MLNIGWLCSTYTLVGRGSNRHSWLGKLGPLNDALHQLASRSVALLGSLAPCLGEGLQGAVASYKTY